MVRRPSPARSPPGCGSRCCSRISPRRSRRAAARRRPTLCAGRAATRAPSGYLDPANLGGLVEGVNALDLRVGDVVLVEAERDHSRRRRDHRGRRLGQRIGDHRRVRAGDPRGRRRPLGRDRRHDGSLRLHQGAHHRRAGLDLHRPDDRACRRRVAAEDAERACAVDPAVRPDADLPDRLRHALAAGALFRRPTCRRPC